MKQIYESGEMYLETILTLMQKNGNVRSIDIAREMGFSKPSVSNAMKALREGGYIVMGDTGMITLTDSGRAIAEKIYERHRVLSECFMRIGVSEETASEDACRIEHVISDETFDALKRHLAKKQ